MKTNTKHIRFTIAIAIIFSCVAVMAQKSQQKPNILLIVVDQQRFDCLELTGHKQVKTPNLNKLAEQGISFNNTHTPIPTCCPARQTLLSGLWPEHHGGLWNYDITLPVQEFNKATWTEELSKNGYNMGYVGKWHVHESKTPLDFGFHDYYSLADYNQYRSKNKIAPIQKLDDNLMFGGFDPAPLEQTRTHKLAAETIELIKKYSTEGKPWHIRFDPPEPHLPCFPVKEYLDLYTADSILPWGNFADDFRRKPYIQKQMLYNWNLEDTQWDRWAAYLQRYFGIITQLDNAIGLVLNALDELGLSENTLVIYTSDHGDAAGSHRMIDKHYVMYEEIIRVPLIMRWPGVIKPQSINNSFVYFGLDIAASIPQIAGFEFETAGQSLLPIMTGDTAGYNDREYIFSNYNGQQFGLYVMRMIKNNRYKYIWNLSDVDELYDLVEDPHELNNLIACETKTDELIKLRKALYSELETRKDPVLKFGVGKTHLIDNKKHLPYGF